MLLTKDQITQSDDRPTLELEVPEWGGSVRIRTLSGSQRDAFEAGILDKNGNATRLVNLRARFCVLVLVNEDGTPMFTDAAQLGDKSANALTRIWETGREFNRMDTDAIESAEENSEAALSGSSGSD